LAAVAALAAAVAELAQIVRASILVGLEVGAGQGVQAQCELRAGARFPALQPALEQLVLGLHEAVQVAVPRVLLGQPG